MAEVYNVSKPSVALHLSLHEAMYMKGLVQNDLTAGGESNEDSKLRQDIWDALDAAGVQLSIETRGLAT